MIGADVTRFGTLEARGFGTLWIVFDDVGVRRIDFTEAHAAPYLVGEPGEVPKEIRVPLERYFEGERVDLRSVPLHLEGTEFQLRVWEALRSIPYGQVRTYASIAAEVGAPRGMRAVGMANSKNPVPIVVACHRVVEAGNRLGGYSGGLDRKRFLLELEGARIEGDIVRPGQLSLF